MAVARKASAKKIKERVDSIPIACRATYTKAMGGHSRRFAILAMCQQCLGWEDYRAGIRECQDPLCPLWPYRPYQEKKKK